MRTRYALGAVTVLAVAFGCADANAQFAWLGGPYPISYYVGPEGGWTSLSNQKDTITTPPFRVDNAVLTTPLVPSSVVSTAARATIAGTTLAPAPASSGAHGASKKNTVTVATASPALAFSLDLIPTRWLPAVAIPAL